MKKTNHKKMTDEELLAEYEKCLSTDFIGAGFAAGELAKRGYQEETIDGKDKMVKVLKNNEAA